MYAKIQITGDIEVITGMHIGGSSAFAAIGAVDSPVIKDVRTGAPMIPGSSLKGKMRTLLARKYNSAASDKPAEKPDDDAECLLRLFGCAKKSGTRKERVRQSRVLISDMFLKNEDELRARGLQNLTEIKFENSINRITAVANPRQIERVVRGAVFGLDIIYEVYEPDPDREPEREKEILEDITMLADGIRLLQYDYIGGSGSRGYGKIAFEHVQAEVVVGDIEDSVMEQCNDILNQKIRN
jgi:CRISPR-associated protein Csm3